MHVPVMRRQSPATSAPATVSTKPWRGSQKPTPTRTSATTRHSNGPSTAERSQPRTREGRPSQGPSALHKACVIDGCANQEPSAPHPFSVMTRRARHPYGLPMRRRLTAVFALVVAAATLVLAIVVAINQFPRGLVLSGCVLRPGVAPGSALRRRGIARVVGVIVAAVALAAAVLLIVTRGAPLVDLLVVAGVLVSLAAASAAFTVHVDLPSAPPPRQPVLFYNPRSGGGKAERFQLAKEARARGIEPIELKPGDDLEVLVRGAVERGADGLA